MNSPEKSPQPNQSSASNVAADSDEIERIRAVAAALLAKAENASNLSDMAMAVEKGAEALKLTAEIRKARAELAKVDEELAKLKYENKTVSKRERSDRLRDRITFFTPIVTIITLAATLGFQGWQFRKSENDRREEALDAQWREAQKSVSQSGEVSHGVVALQPFLRSAKYGEQARDLAVSLLSNTSNPGFFASLFGPALTPVTPKNIDKLLQLDRRLYVRVRPLDDKTWDEKKSQNDRNRLSKDEIATYEYILDNALPEITAELGSFLKTQSASGHPPTQLNLANTEFTRGNWQNIVLKGVNLENADIAWTDLKGAQLEVTDFNGFYPYGTAWWEAKSINKELLTYLINFYPLQVGRSYGPRSELKTEASYTAEVGRLTSQAK